LQGHRLQTAEQAEHLYQKREKKAAPNGWEAFTNKTLFKAYEKRAEGLPIDMEVPLIFLSFQPIQELGTRRSLNA